MTTGDIESAGDPPKLTEASLAAPSVEPTRGVVPLSRKQLKARVRADLDGLDLVCELLAERRPMANDDEGR